MKAKLDKVQKGKKKVVGLKTQLVGRIRGSTRSRKMVYTWGNQGQQDRLRRIEYTAGTIQTRYGTLGLKVQCGIKKQKGLKRREIIEKLEKSEKELYNIKELKENLRRNK